MSRDTHVIIYSYFQIQFFNGMYWAKIAYSKVPTKIVPYSKFSLHNKNANL